MTVVDLLKWMSEHNIPLNTPLAVQYFVTLPDDEDNETSTLRLPLYDKIEDGYIRLRKEDYI